MAALTKPKRYQVTKEVLQILLKGHPWIFRSHLSSAATIFKSGQLLSLTDSQNKTVGYGIYDEEGLIAIRVLKMGENKPDKNWFEKFLQKAILKREHLKKYTNAYRVIHGENDGFPGIVVDLYKDVLVLQTYSRSVDIYGRYLEYLLKKIIKIENVIWKVPSKRTSKDQKPKVRTLSGFISPQISFLEGKLDFKVNIFEGQKSGLFLDLRGLRKFLTQLDLKNKTVLNLFSYTGTLGLACEVAGAKKITQVDISEGALNYSKKYHTKDASKHEFIKADIFDYIKEINQKFDLIIVDPPQMTSKKEQLPTVLKAYHSLYANSSKLLTEKGMIIACCCTGKLSRDLFEKETRRYLSQFKLEKKIMPEDDHPASFSEGDYLKILVYKKGY